MAKRSSNSILVKGAAGAMDQFKQEVASEIGIQNYMANGYGGDLPSKVNGTVGGYMVKKMIAMAEDQIANNGTSSVSQYPATPGETYGAKAIGRNNPYPQGQTK